MDQIPNPILLVQMMHPYSPLLHMALGYSSTLLRTLTADIHGRWAMCCTAGTMLRTDPPGRCMLRAFLGTLLRAFLGTRQRATWLCLLPWPALTLPQVSGYPLLSKPTPLSLPRCNSPAHPRCQPTSQLQWRVPTLLDCLLQTYRQMMPDRCQLGMSTIADGNSPSKSPGACKATLTATCNHLKGTCSLTRVTRISLSTACVSHRAS